MNERGKSTALLNGEMVSYLYTYNADIVNYYITYYIRAIHKQQSYLVFLHQINQECDSIGLEVNITVKGEQVGVLRQDLLPVNRDGQLHQLMAEQVVHVHALRPPLLVPNLGLVLHVDDHLGLAWEGVDEPAAVRGRHLLGRSQPNVCLVDVAAGQIDAGHEVADKLVDLVPVVAHVRDFEGVVEVDVGFEFIVVGVNHLDIYTYISEIKIHTSNSSERSYSFYM